MAPAPHSAGSRAASPLPSSSSSVRGSSALSYLCSSSPPCVCVRARARAERGGGHARWVLRVLRVTACAVHGGLHLLKLELFGVRGGPGSGWVPHCTVGAALQLASAGHSAGHAPPRPRHPPRCSPPLRVEMRGDVMSRRHQQQRAGMYGCDEAICGALPRGLQERSEYLLEARKRAAACCWQRAPPSPAGLPIKPRARAQRSCRAASGLSSSSSPSSSSASSPTSPCRAQTGARQLP